MARIPLVDSTAADVDPKAKEALDFARGLRGRAVDPNVYRAMANHPDVLRKLVELGTVAYFENSMTPAQRELAYLTASVTNDCHY